jgi:hypothetical protein
MVTYLEKTNHMNDSPTVFSPTEHKEQEQTREVGPPETNPLVPVSFFANRHDVGDDRDFDDRNQPILWWHFACLLARSSRDERPDKTSQMLFAPTVFKKDKQLKPDGTPYEGPRCHPNATTSAMVPLDLDGDFAFGYVRNWLIETGCEGVLYSSASHTHADPRLRLILPLSSEVDPATHMLCGQAIVNLLRPGYRLLDTTKQHPGSLFYLPAQYASAEENLFFYYNRGGVLSANDWIDLGGVTNAAPPAEVPRYTAPLSRDALWNYDEPLDRYLSLSSGRHTGLFSMMVGIGMKALHAGYDLSEGELASIASDAQRMNPPTGRYGDLREPAARALDQARCNVTVPAWELHEARHEEMRQALASSFDVEPNWPSSWRDEARETIAEIQSLRRSQLDVEEALDIDDTADIDLDTPPRSPRPTTVPTVCKKWRKPGCF